MNKRKAAIIGITILAAIIAFSLAMNALTNVPEETPVPDPLKEQIETMSLQEKIGQLIIVGVDEYEVNDNALRLIREYYVGGFVLFKKNIRDADQMLALVNSLKEANAANAIPLFLALDEEGGSVSRMPPEFMKMPPAKRIGAREDEVLAKRAGEILAEEIKAFGMNVNFAPVLDIFSNPKNTVIADRAFGTEAEQVRKQGAAAMQGIREQGVISVAKHFPGHGDTAVDSHVRLPQAEHDLGRLKSFELVPFVQAVADRADAIMMAHILFPNIDPDFPASLSQVFMDGILRTEMNYDGVIITDDMTMGAITQNYDIGEAAVVSFRAGSDIILVCHDFANQEAVFKALRTAAETGEIPLDRIDESVYRILKLKENYALSDEKAGSVDVQGLNAKIEQLYRDYPAIK